MPMDLLYFKVIYINSLKNFNHNNTRIDIIYWDLFIKSCYFLILLQINFHHIL